MSKMAYAWKAGAHAPVKANVAGPELDRIRRENGGFFTPASVVAAARPANAPLHPAFEWDDSRAAELYRGEQAKYLIRNVVVVNPADPDSAPIRAFVSIRDDDDASQYTTLAKAMANPELREQVLSDALRDMQSFERKYAQFSELAGVVREIRHARRKLTAQDLRSAA